MKANWLAGGLCLGISVSVWAGNQALMDQAEKNLRELNRRALEQVSREQVPENGRVRITAQVRGSGADAEIKVKEVKSQPPADGGEKKDKADE